MAEIARAGGGLPDQSAAVSELATMIANDRRGPWSRFVFQLRALRPYLQGEVMVTKPDGSVAQEFPPDDATDLMLQLRDSMYRPGAGTWYSARVSVTADGTLDADFDYDDEPAWTRPVEAIWYAQDLEKYPRDEAARPAWLRQRLSEAFAAE